MVAPKKPLKESPSQTAGPYVHIGCTPNFSGITGIFERDLGTSLFVGNASSEQIEIEGTIFDGDGIPLVDAVMESWQADATGIYNSPNDRRSSADPNFIGWRRIAVDTQSGVFRIQSIKPGNTPYSDSQVQAPHINIWIVARGINIGLQTRMYFEDEEEANSVDPVLNAIGSRERIDTLLARKQADGIYRFNVHLQGPEETVFFDF